MSKKAGEINDDDMMGGEELIKTKEKEKTSEPQGLIENPDRAELEAKLTEAEDKVLSLKSEMEDMRLRLAAESENIRRRLEKQIEEAHKYGISRLLEELVPVLDSLEQSLTIQDIDHELVKSMREGMAMTLQIMMKTLEKFGVKTINPINEIFNPALHEVMLAQEKSDVSPNTIIAVMQKGYQLHDRLIRPARVMIAKSGT